MRESIKRRADRARSSTPLQVLARAGLVADGLVHILIGCAAITLALGADAKVDTSGALEGFARSTIGLILLVAIAATLYALTLWQIFTAFAVRVQKRTARWSRRIAELGKGLAYGVVGATATIIALGGRVDQEESSKSISSWLLSSPGGVFVLLAGGAAILIAGIVFVVMGAFRRFVTLIRVPAGPGGSLLVALGVVGYIAKGIAIGAVGVLFLIAATSSDPGVAGGLDGALKSLLGLPFGEVLLIVLGAGVVLYGIFFVARSRFAKI